MAHFKTTKSVILASTSRYRKSCMGWTGVAFRAMPASVDEENELKPQYGHLPPDQQAMKLAEEKGLSISRQYPDAIVIAGDQICEMGGEIFEKPGTKPRQLKQLKQLRGNTHTLHTAICICVNGKVIWRDLAQPTLSLRDLSDEEVEAYVNLVDATDSCGGYNIDELGWHLVAGYTGDYFAIIGLQLAPLVAKLHEMGVVEMRP